MNQGLGQKKKIIKEEEYNPYAEQNAWIEEIYQILKQAGLYPDEVFHDDNSPGPVMTVRVDGDWKHDHLATKWALEKEGWNEIKEVQLEDTGDDCYPADHYVIKWPKETINALRQMFGGSVD